MSETLLAMEHQFDGMDGTVKELRHIHNVKLAKPTEGVIDQLHDRWKQLLNDCQTRQDNLQQLNGDYDGMAALLQGWYLLLSIFKDVKLFLQIEWPIINGKTLTKLSFSVF